MSDSVGEPLSHGNMRISVALLGACSLLVLVWLITQQLYHDPLPSGFLLMLTGPTLWYLYTHGSALVWPMGVLIAYWPLGKAIAKNKVTWRPTALTILLWLVQGFILGLPFIRP